MFGRSREEIAVQARDPAWWWRGVLKALTAFVIAWAAVYVPLSLAAERYRIAFDVAEEKCLPQWLFLVDLKDQDVSRGDYVAFRSGQMEPYFPNGTLIVKILAGVPGDDARVDEHGATVAGVDWGPLHYLKPGAKLAEEGRTLDEYRRARTDRARDLLGDGAAAGQLRQPVLGRDRSGADRWTGVPDSLGVRPRH